jgi:hypothetical protein
MCGVVFHVHIGLKGGNICHTGTLASLFPCTFALIGGNGAAPEKAFGETHVSTSILSVYTLTKLRRIFHGQFRFQYTIHTLGLQ